MADLEAQIIKQYRLTTAEIFYGFPDYPDLLQSYIWQDYDYAPKFPVLGKFLEFWEHEIEGKIHSIQIANYKLITPGDFKACHHEITVQ